MTTLQEKSVGAGRAEASKASGRARLVHPGVIGAIAKRDFYRFFFSPAGYVYITLFVAISAVLAFWLQGFFTRNLANLDLLNNFMPYLLVIFIPAVTMTVWADERKQGTDELLLTLPANDLDVVLGKYFASLGIYSLSLAFTLPHVLMLLYLGEPDLGVMCSTYLGYWLMGALLIAVGMLASLLSSNATVAFIVGVLLSAIPVFAWVFGPIGGGEFARQIEALSIPEQFHDFGTGVLTFSGLFYFVTAAGCVLYINMVLLGRRHWAGGQRSGSHWLHSLARIVCLGLALASLNLLVGRVSARVDLSQEHLHTLSPESLTLLKQISKDKPVYIQAYFSPEVPRDFVQTKSDLLGLLKEYAARGGDRIRLNLVETQVYSDEARKAEKQFGIEPRKVPSNDQGKQSVEDVILGVAFSSGLEEVVIPFFDRGLPVEYELTRSIRVVSRSSRKKVRILATDAKLMGGFDMRTMGQNPEWSIVTELKKQYDVNAVSADTELPNDIDVLLVAQPSSLTQRQIDNLTAYVRRGGPTLLFLDPFPFVDPQIAPEVPRQAPGGPFGGGQPPEPKGDLRPLLDLLAIEWPTTDIIWNPYNPLQQNPDLPPEVVFIGKGSTKDAFNQEDMLTAGLQEVVAIFAGALKPRGGPGPEFTPLLRTSREGGIVPYDRLTRRGMLGGVSINNDRPHIPTGQPYTLAAHIKGDPAPSSAPAAEKGKEPKPAKVHAVAIADLDIISEEFFTLRRQKIESLELDNVTFVLNCVDVLAGDDAFVTLRKKRLHHRTLTRLEAQMKDFIAKFQEETKSAEDEAKEQLELAQKNLNKEVAAVRARTDVDDRTKEILLGNLEEVANRRLEVQKANIEDKKRRKIYESKADSEVQTRGIRNRVRWEALLEAVPPVMLGLVVFGLRIRRENYGANPNRIA